MVYYRICLLKHLPMLQILNWAKLIFVSNYQIAPYPMFIQGNSTVKISIGSTLRSKLPIFHFYLTLLITTKFSKVIRDLYAELLLTLKKRRRGRTTIWQHAIQSKICKYFLIFEFTHFILLVSFYIPENIKKTLAFLWWFEQR